MSVASQLLIWGTVASGRTEAMITDVVQQGERAARLQSPILWATDGFTTWKAQIMHFVRSAVQNGRRGRPRLAEWTELHSVQVVKRTYG
ncbi:hypothetical protein Q0M94_24970 (plasmid) [Deinococcus radiomollis]|uniref:hypothetical protein n=1 Tax=Deinococcus radiomollis TaxID=468916 RepID=UPI0038914797